jgi:DHA2 family multidrug resistance protein
MSSLTHRPTVSSPPRPQSRNALQIAVSLGAFFVVSAASQLLTTGLPAVQEAAGASAAAASWTATAYIAGLFVGVVLATPLVRTFGLGRYSAGCAALFAALAWAACASPPDLHPLVALRGAQGLAAGGLGPAAFVAVFTLSGPARLLGGLAVMALAILLPNALGAALSGAVVAEFGWRGLFAAQAAAGLVAAIAAYLWLPRPPVNKAALRTDWPALISLGLALSGLTAALSQGARLGGFASGWVAAATALSVLGAAVFAVRVKRRPGAVLAPDLLLRAAFARPVALLLVFRIGFAVTAYLAPQALLMAAGSAGELGVPFAVAALSQVAALPLVWWLLHRVDGRWLIAGGLGLFAAATGWLAAAASHPSTGSFSIPLALASLGQLMFLVTALQAGGSVLGPADGPSATLIFNVISTGGLTLGVASAAQILGPAAQGQALTQVLVLFGVLLLAGALAARVILQPLPPLVRGRRVAA